MAHGRRPRDGGFQQRGEGTVAHSSGVRGAVAHSSEGRGTVVHSSERGCHPRRTRRCLRLAAATARPPSVTAPKPTASQASPPRPELGGSAAVGVDAGCRARMVVFVAVAVPVGLRVAVAVGPGVALGVAMGVVVGLGLVAHIGWGVHVGLRVAVAVFVGAGLGVGSSPLTRPSAGGRVGEAAGGGAPESDAASSTSISGGPPSTHPCEQSAPPSWTV